MNEKIKFEEIFSNENSVSFKILSDDTCIGSIEGYIGNNTLTSVIHIDKAYQKQGIGFIAFEKIYNTLNQNNNIQQIAGSWCKDEEFSYCDDGMSSNLKIFLENSNLGLSDTQSAFNTPTGKWAKKLGFNKCRIDRKTNDSVHVSFFK